MGSIAIPYTTRVRRDRWAVQGAIYQDQPAIQSQDAWLYQRRLETMMHAGQSHWA